ncbi:phenylacetate--CoA ligase [Candidatus Bathyarchaeota archaeon]|nr:MAG: phenylacetate--CoA ligase [Candidatus Bathyarchaeota archaeon]
MSQEKVFTEDELLKKYPLYWNEKLETMPRAELDELKLKKFKEIVKIAYDNSPFYRRRFKEAGITPDDIRSLKDVTKVPIFGKKELREAQAKNPPYGGLLTVPEDQIAFVAMTTGTTGTPTLVAWTYEDFWQDVEASARSWWCAGISPIDIVDQTNQYNFYFSAHICEHAAMKIGAMIVPGGAGNTRRHAQVIKDLGVTALWSVPSYSLYIAKIAREELGIDPEKDWRIRWVGGGGEPGFSLPEVKRKIREAFGGKAREIVVRDRYGATEIGKHGAECPAESGMHLFEDLALYEIIDPKSGEPVNPGESGELVVTCFYKKGMPFIRYNMHDVFRYTLETCECGRTSMRVLGGMLGRTDDMLKVKGAIVFPSQIQEVVSKISELSGNYRIVIDKDQMMLDELIIEVEAKAPLKPKDEERIIEEIRKEVKARTMVTPTVKVLPPNSLPTFVVKHIPIYDKRKEKEYLAKLEAQRKMA